MFKNFLMAAMLITTFLTSMGCTNMKQKFIRWNNPISDPVYAKKMADVKHEEMLKRVVYTPLINSGKKSDLQKLEILLRSPKKEYKEIGLISMYQQNKSEQASDLLPYMKERAAMEGADAIILFSAEEKPIGVVSNASAGTIGQITLASGYSSFATEGSLRGIAIIYEE